jgi:hypothetical protein
MTKVTADQVASIKAALKGDAEDFSRIDEQLDPAAKGARGALVAAAFAQAAYRRFAKSGNAKADVIRFVADMRARYPLTEDFDSRTAERLLLAVFTDEQVSDISDDVKGTHYMLLLTGIIKAANLSDTELDRFLDDARGLADGWLE